jgi:sec-independent protein translocase protein TatA
MYSLFALLNSPQEWLVILVVGVLLFGRRLPEVGRYLGKGIVEFKKGLKGLEDEIDVSSSMTSRHDTAPPALEQPRPPQRVQTSAPKFEDVPGPITPPTPPSPPAQPQV